MSYDHIWLTVAVVIQGRNSIGASGQSRRHCLIKRSVAFANQDAQRVPVRATLRVGRDHIGNSIPIDVIHDNCLHRAARSCCWRYRIKRVIGVAKQNAQGAVCVVAHGQIVFPVIVEISDSN